MNKEELEKLRNEFEKHNLQILENLEKGADIIIKKKKDSYKIYCNLIKKM